VPSEDGADRRPQTIGGGVYLLVVASALVGLAVTVVGAWRTGVIWIGVGLLAGGVARLLLPERQAGMLRVREKAADVVLMLLVGSALVVLAVVVPDQPAR
jgi:predicted phage tail protein